MIPSKTISLRLRLPFKIHDGMMRVHCAAWLMLLTMITIERSESAEIDFARDVRPLLSDRCLLCHGPDSTDRASELRLDEPASAYALAIKPGRPGESELIRRITSDDADEVMPPPDSNLQLSVAEKELLQAWVEQGAEYAKHWAFVTPTKPALPPVRQASWSRNDLDRFVLSRLELEKLAPRPDADAETILRRVSLDLTGLPPSVEDIDNYLADQATEPEAAYERVVDRLLASRRFGERMAVDWLDVARYADTYGYQSDRYRPMWPWRDWVVKAFNENLPYNDFVTWQLAGDLLPQATRDQILATAFNRNHRQTNEGGSVDEEFRAEYVADRVNTFGAAFLGLTLECCRCHDHKYDPLTQRDYYQLSAFFNSIDESGLYSHFTEATPTPTLVLASESEERELAHLQSQISAKEQELSAWQPAAGEFEQWRAQLADVRQRLQPAPVATGSSGSQRLSELLQASLHAALIGDFSLDQLEAGKLLNRVDQTWSGQTSENPQPATGRVKEGLQLSGENHVRVKTGGDFTRNQPFTISLWLKTPRRFERAVVFHRSRAWSDSGSRGYELLIEQGKLSAALIHFWPGNALRIVSRDDLPINAWMHVSLRYDGSSRASGLQLFVNGQVQECDVVRDNLTKHIKGADGLGGGDADELAFGQRFRDVGFKDGQIDELKIFTRDLSNLELKLIHLRDVAPDNQAEALHNTTAAELQDFYHRLHPERMALSTTLRQLRDRRSELGDPIAEIMVMREEPRPRPTFVLNRGAYDAPGEPVERGVPRSILDRPLPDKSTRLDLAQWLVDPQHPLTSRVAVNRLWQMLFGVGLVSTTEDFGFQGATPSHPELMDWLSVDFIESGWDMKRLIKLIVMSSTYRQSSDPTAQLLEIDPENRLLARGPATRLTSEMIRDTALASGGLLVETPGGPPVKPYQPPGMWEEKSGLVYKRDAQAGSHRRSLYTFWKRTSPPPNMMTFDASNREVCVVRRQVTMTPLQMLVLLNDPQFVEAARALAERAINVCANPEDRAAFVFRSLTGRRPSAQQTEVLLAMVDSQRKLFKQDETARAQWLAIGDHRSNDQLDAVELSAWSVVASGLVSFDETVMKR
jgi:hypothetical protein